MVISYRINTRLVGAAGSPSAIALNAAANPEREKIWASYAGLAVYFARAGKRVIVVAQAPEPTQDVRRLIFQTPDPSTLPAIDRSVWQAGSAYLASRLRDLPPDVTVIDPAESFCDESICYAARDGRAYYYDNHHMSVTGARLVADEILRRAGQPPAR